MAIDSTAGGASADSYVDNTDASTYFGTRLYATEWEAASPSDQEKALKWATMLLEQKPWVGSKATEAAALRWPRESTWDLDGVALSSTLIPKFLEQATAELALQLLIENRTTDSDTAGFSKIKADVIELEIDKYDVKEIIPKNVMDIIAPYMQAEGVRLQRV